MTHRSRLALAAAAALAISACSDSGRDGATPPPGLIALSDQFSSDFSLVDQDGAVIRDDDLKGKVGIVYFGFASCPDVCPLALGRLSAALNELKPAELAKVVPLFITVDPDRDTPERLKTYLAFDARIRGLTGDRAAIEQAKANFKVFAEPEPVEDSKLGYTMQHSSLFYIIERSGKLTVALQDSLTPAEIAQAIRRFL